jgi:uncharacterized protein (DUF2384 family)
MLLEAVLPLAVEELVDELADRLDTVATPWAYDSIDPYLGQSLLAALLAGSKGLRAPNQDDRRRRVRLALERVRQTLRDIADEAPAADSAETKHVAQWLAETLSVPQTDIAGLLGVSTRTLQRWLSPDGPSPEGADEARVRMAARTVAHLRHVFTGPGVVRWFMRSHPGLGGRSPVELLQDPLQGPELIRLAARSRSTMAT